MELGQARHLEAVYFPLVSGYLITHHRGKEISISAVCFMRSPQCQAAVSKQQPLPSEQLWQAWPWVLQARVPWR